MDFNNLYNNVIICLAGTVFENIIYNSDKYEKKKVVKIFANRYLDTFFYFDRMTTHV